ncbi:MAG: DUF1761 domain-containing protein [Bauldia sp.]
MVNILAVVVAAFVMFAIGAAWYTALFGQQWRDLQGIKGGAQPEPMALIVGFLGNLVEAYVLARVIVWYGSPGIISGIVAAVVLWAGFVAAIMVPTIYYERKPPMVVAINASYQLVGLVVMGAILGLWR